MNRSSIPGRIVAASAAVLLAALLGGCQGTSPAGPVVSPTPSSNGTSAPAVNPLSDPEHAEAAAIHQRALEQAAVAAKAAAEKAAADAAAAAAQAAQQAAADQAAAAAKAAAAAAAKAPTAAKSSTSTSKSSTSSGTSTSTGTAGSTGGTGGTAGGTSTDPGLPPSGTVAHLSNKTCTPNDAGALLSFTASFSTGYVVHLSMQTSGPSIATITSGGRVYPVDDGDFPCLAG